jgi:DNA-binding transcriptional LysR family regulator
MMSGEQMKLLWIEDFLALVDAGTFSRAAALRNVTQPAFSRRIQMLEAWLDVELIDRRSQPLRLTAVAERHVPEFRAMLRNMDLLRSRMQAENSGAARLVLATQHSLTMTRLPLLIKRLAPDNDAAARIDFSVRSENRDDCVALFLRGEADLLLCMEESDDLLHNLIPEASRLPMGHERLIPLSAPTRKGKPLFAPRAGSQDKDAGTSALKLLAFPMDSFLGRVTYKHGINTLFRHHQVEIVHESVFLAGIKEMALAGLGMAWLPESLVKRELRSGALVALDDTLASVPLELGLYRSARPRHPDAMQRLWTMLGARPTSLRAAAAATGRHR